MSELELLHLIQNIHTPFFDGLMVLITTLGNAGMVWLVTAAALLFTKKTRRCGLLMLVSMFLCLIVGNVFLKNAVGRARPCWIDNTVPLLIAAPSDYSFPSGHAMHSFTAAFMLWFHNRKVGSAALFLAGLIAFSRLYLFVHYPTDVLAGFCIGTLVATAVYKGAER